MYWYMHQTSSGCVNSYDTGHKLTLTLHVHTQMLTRPSMFSNIHVELMLKIMGSLGMYEALHTHVYMALNQAWFTI